MTQKVDMVKQWLPQVLPEMLVCSRLTEADMRNIIQTKEDDLVLERDDGNGQAANDDEELENHTQI